MDNIASVVPRDVIDRLTDDHLRLREAFLDFENLGEMDFHTKQDVVVSICQDLLIHMIAEENAFYPIIRNSIPHGEDTIDQSIAEHEEAKAVVIQLQHMTPESASYNMTVKILSELFHNHALEEENYIFPLVRDTSLDLVELGIQLQKAKDFAQ